MLFRELVEKLLEPISSTTKKLEQTEILANFLPSLSVGEIEPVTHFVLGRLGPVYANPVLQVARQLFLQAVGQAAERSGFPSPSGQGGGLFGESPWAPWLSSELKRLGDPGLLLYQLWQQNGISGDSLDTTAVIERLLAIAQLHGEGSQDEKVSYLSSLFLSLSAGEAKYVARFVLGNMRLGFSEKTYLDALSYISAGDKSARNQFDLILQRHPNIGALAKRFLTKGLSAAEQLDVEVGVPVQPALCDRLRSSAEMIAKMGEVLVDPKYDGTRVQIHWSADGVLRTYTRNLEESSYMFPELATLLEKLNVDSIIIDSEAVGFNPATGELRPFQETIRRKRKHNIDEVSQEIPLQFFVFDVLFLNGRSLLSSPLSERRAVIDRVFAAPALGQLVPAPYWITKDPAVIDRLHHSQLEKKLEGVIVKKLDAPYQPGRSAFTWVKMKDLPGSRGQLSDTIDAVVLGTYAGRGKRTVFGVGAFLIGLWDEKKEAIVTIAKIGTGLSDEQWRELYQRTTALRSVGQDYSVLIPESLQPDRLVPPILVVEVAADAVTKSPLHSAGLALRFPRLIRFRDDKSVTQTTSPEELARF